MRQLPGMGELFITLVRAGSDWIMSLQCYKMERPLEEEAGNNLIAKARSLHVEMLSFLNYNRGNNIHLLITKTAPKSKILGVLWKLQSYINTKDHRIHYYIYCFG